MAIISHVREISTVYDVVENPQMILLGGQGSHGVGISRGVALNYIGLKSIGHIMLHYIQCSCPYIWLAERRSNIHSKITWSKMTVFDHHSTPD